MSTIDTKKVLATESRNSGYLSALMDSLGEEERGEPIGTHSSPYTLRYEMGAMAREMRGERQQPVRSHKIGRNDPCPCGSGRKYKKCCGK